jgi:hypothetical protein
LKVGIEEIAIVISGKNECFLVVYCLYTKIIGQRHTAYLAFRGALDRKFGDAIEHFEEVEVQELHGLDSEKANVARGIHKKEVCHCDTIARTRAA